VLVMIDGVAFWAFLGSLYLGILTYQDIRNNMRVDDRKNWFMFGVTVMLLSHFDRSIWYVFLVIGLVMLLAKFLLRFKLVGAGDISGLSWVFLGFGWIDPSYLLLFVVVFVFCTVVWQFFARLFVKLGGLFSRNSGFKLPFFGVILISFVASCVILGLYW